MLFAIVFDGLVVVTAFIAAWRGDWCERWGAAVILVATAFTALATGPLASRFSGLDLVLLSIDLCTLVAFAIIANMGRKYWPIWTAAFQLLSVLATMAHMLKPERHALIYAINEQSWAWLIVAIVLVASAFCPKTNSRLSACSELSTKNERR